LTQASVEKMQPPKAGRLDIWDAVVPGLALRIPATGRKVWLLAYRMPGSRQKIWHTIGPLGSVPSLTDARERARVILADAAKGTTPAVSKRAAMTFGEARDRFLAEGERRWRANTIKSYRQSLRTNLAVWDRRPLREIGRRDVLEAINDKAQKGAPIAAARMLVRLRSFVGWAIAADLIEADPTANVRKPAQDGRRDRVLTDAELVAFWRATERHGSIYACLRMMLLKAQREAETAGMRWHEIDFDERIWTIPSERAKNGKAHIVHLNSLAIETIAKMQRIDGTDLVFPGQRKKPVNGWSSVKKVINDAMGDCPPWVFHDLRRTAATTMARLNVRAEIVEKLLNHSGSHLGPIASIYNRHQYLDERRGAIEAWGNFLDSLIRPAPSNVVALR